MRIWIILLLLVGCTAPVTEPAPVPAGLRFGTGALYPVASPLEISFGRYIDGTIPAVSRLLGETPDATRNCPGAGRAQISVVHYEVGVTLAFSDRHLTGWKISGAGLQTAAGTDVGSRPDDVPGGGYRYHWTSTDGGPEGAKIAEIYVWNGATWPQAALCPQA